MISSYAVQFLLCEATIAAVVCMFTKRRKLFFLCIAATVVFHLWHVSAAASRNSEIIGCCDIGDKSVCLERYDQQSGGIDFSSSKHMEFGTYATERQ